MKNVLRYYILYMKEFGRNYYNSFVYFNFDEEDELKSIFEVNKNPYRIIELLSMISGERILSGETLIIFDEIQEGPEALNTLKYFKEKANDYHVIATGSLLGILLAQPKSYEFTMYPRWSIRFLLLTNWINSNFLCLIQDCSNIWQVLTTVLFF